MTLALYGKRRQRHNGLLLFGLMAVIAAALAGAALMKAERASADSNTFAASSASCVDPFQGPQSLTENGPTLCSTADAAALDAGGATVNIETDDFQADLFDGFFGSDDLTVSFNIGSIPDDATITTATLNVYSIVQDGAGTLNVGSSAGGSQYGSLAAGSPQAYTVIPANVASALDSNTFTVRLSMDCIPNSDDCGRLIDQASLFVEWAPAAATGTLTIDKLDSTEGYFGTIYWTIAIHNPTGSPKAAYILDATPATLVSSTGCEPAATQGGPVGIITCLAVPTGDAGGDPEATVTVTTDANIFWSEVCSGYTRTNSAYLVESPDETSASQDDPNDTATARIAAVADRNCLSVTKTHDDANPGTWKITFSNIGPEAQVNFSDTYEPAGTGSTIDGAPEGCTAVGPTRLEGCDVLVPANGSVDVIVTTTDFTCDEVSNTVTAYFGPGGPNGPGPSIGTASDDRAEAGCIKVEKNAIGFGTPPRFDIEISSSDDVAVKVWIQDPTAVSYLIDNPTAGECDVADTDISDGLSCTVNAGFTLHIIVTVGTPPATCEGTNVTNRMSLWVGDFQATPLTPADHESNSTHVGSNAQRGECRVPIQICKLFALDLPGELPNEFPSNFSFQVSDTEEDPFETLTLDVVEGTRVCEILSVKQGRVDITEVVPDGFTLDGWTLEEGDFPNTFVPPYDGTTNPMTIYVNDQFCTTEPVAFRALALVRSVERVIIGEGEEEDIVCTITFFNHDDGNVLPSGDLRIEKYIDINGDGDADEVELGEGPINGWHMTINGPEIINEIVETSVVGPDAGVIFRGGLTTGDVYTVTEDVMAGYTVTNATVNGVSQGAVTVAAAVIPQGGAAVIAFYNQPKGSINIHKEAQTRHNGITSPAPNDDDGWTITLDSEDCDINFVGQTDANGNLSFTGLPLCDDYVVSEAAPNASSPGFVIVSPAGGNFTDQTPEGQTLTFLNRRVTNDPPCQDCRQETPTPTSTPTTPTATPTTPTTTVTPPTNTPTDPTAVPSEPTSIVEGEKTPGPGQTPIAPSAGSGLFGEGGSGFNLLLVLAGLVALTGGLSFLALGRRSSR